MSHVHIIELFLTFFLKKHENIGSETCLGNCHTRHSGTSIRYAYASPDTYYNFQQSLETEIIFMLILIHRLHFTIHFTNNRPNEKKTSIC